MIPSKDVGKYIRDWEALAKSCGQALGVRYHTYARACFFALQAKGVYPNIALYTKINRLYERVELLYFVLHQTQAKNTTQEPNISHKRSKCYEQPISNAISNAVDQYDNHYYSLSILVVSIFCKLYTYIPYSRLQTEVTRELRADGLCVHNKGLAAASQPWPMG